MFSIIIPSYQQKEFLEEAIVSALQQDYEYPYEILVVDDGSTDGSYDIAAKYATEHPVKVVLISQVNKGLASARNTGIMNAMGDWILPLDADDKLEPTALRRIEETIKANKHADIIGLSFTQFGDAEGEIVLSPTPVLDDFRTGNRIGYCSAIRKSKLLAVGGYNPRMLWGYEDLHLTINLLTRGARIVTIPEALWRYRVKAQSMITTAREHHQELLGIINKDFPEALLTY